MIIKCDTDKLQLLAESGGKLVFNREAEDALLALLKIEEEVAKAKERAKALIEQAGTEYNPNFTSVQGEKVKAGFQMFGAKYSIDESHLEDLPTQLYKTKVTHSPISEEVDHHVREKGSLPLGIRKKERTRKVTFRRIGDFQDEAAA